MDCWASIVCAQAAVDDCVRSCADSRVSLGLSIRLTAPHLRVFLAFVIAWRQKLRDGARGKTSRGWNLQRRAGRGG